MKTLKAGKIEKVMISQGKMALMSLRHDLIDELENDIKPTIRFSDDRIKQFMLGKSFAYKLFIARVDLLIERID